MPKFEGHFRRSVVWMMLIAVCTYLPQFARADSSTANLSVSVSDSSGAVIPDAHLVLRNSDTNQEQQAESGRAGSATFSFLKPGHYTLTVSKDGFADIVVGRILLNVGDDKHLQLSLKVGSAAQTIDVDSSEITLNTSDASVSTLIDRKFVENIPLNGRSFQDLVSLTPGVVTQSPQASSSIGYRGDFSVNGQRTESNYYIIDGVSGNVSAGNGQGTTQSATSGSIAASTSLGTTQSLLSLDSLQEFRVESSTYAAEYGRSPGGQFSFVTRSGTQSFHGSAFDFLRNNYIDANDWFNNHNGKAATPLRQNDFGGTFGGPLWIPGAVWRDKNVFFFFSYEGLRLTQPQAAATLYVPDLFLRQQAPSSLRAVLNAFPMPTNGPQDKDYGSPTNPSLATFIMPYSLPSSIDSTSIRVDHSFSPQLALFFRYANTPSVATTRTLSTVAKTAVNSETYTLGATSQIGDRIANELRLGFADSTSAIRRTLDSFGGAQAIDLGSAVGFDSTAGSTPAAIVQLSFSGIGTSNLQIADRQNHARQWNPTDSLSVSAGHHQMKFGFDYRHYSSPLSPPSLFANTGFSSAQAVLNNKTTTLNLQRYLSSTPIFNETAVYAQDQWRVTRKVTLSFGLRWEIDPPPTEANGNAAYTVSGSIANPSTLTLAPRGTPLWQTTWYNFAPRLGVAWVAHDNPGWETILRTGGGVFFDSDNQVASSGFQSVGFYALKSYAGSPLPLTSSQTNFGVTVSPPYSAAVYAFPAHLQLPYSLQWNASMEQSLGKTQAMTLSYVGSSGRRLLATQQMTIASLNPNFGTLLYLTPGITSNYQALQMKFQRSATHGLSVLGSYTWAHNTDFGSNSTALANVRGNSDYDVRHNLQGGLNWDLPSIKRGGMLTQMLLHQWSIDSRLIVRTAFPVTLTGNLITDPVTGTQYYGNVNLVSEKPIYLYGNQYPGGRAINKAAFTASASGLGNAPRNFVRGFGESQLNFAVRRGFHLYEGAELQFRAEAFNVLNHPNFGYIDPTLTDATFGQVTQMLNSSLGTVSSLYQQGGSRSMQFALSLHF